MAAAFPLVSLPYWPWITAVADTMRRESRARVDAGKDRPDWAAIEFRQSIISRASKMVACVKQVRGHHCETCGRPADKNGVLVGVREHGECHARSCPRCARRRSAQVRRWGEVLKGNVATMQTWCDGHGLKYAPRLITLTGVHRPECAEDHTVDALRARWQGLRDAFRAIWAHEVGRVLDHDVWRVIDVPANEARRYRKNRRLGASPTGGEFVVKRDPERVRKNREAASFLGAWATVELAGTGHIHLHCLFFGPWVDLHAHDAGTGVALPGWVDVGRRAYPALGEIADVELADGDAIGELAKYPVKIPGGADAAWLAGSPCMTPDGEPGLIHPVLAARWELALFNSRVGDSYGSFRQTALPEDVEIEESTAPTKPCSHCGGTHWREMYWPVTAWVRFCQKAEVEPLGNPRAVRQKE